MTIDDEDKMTKYFEVYNPEVSSLDIGMLYLRNRIRARNCIMKFKGTVAFITGAGAGFGKAFTYRIVEEGAGGE